VLTAARRNRTLRHCPYETGPTLYLPFSQGYLPGYMATALPEFRDYFDKHRVQLPLAKGDAVFFNPALFSCRGNQPLEGRPPHRQSAAGLLGLRPRDGERRPAEDEPRTLSSA